MSNNANPIRLGHIYQSFESAPAAADYKNGYAEIAGRLFRAVGTEWVLVETDRPKNNVVVVGDSLAMQCSTAPSISAMSAENGIVTAGVTRHGFQKSEVCVVANADPDIFNGAHEINVIDENTIRFSIDSSYSGLASGSPSITQNWRISERNYVQWANLKNFRVNYVANLGQSGAVCDEVLSNIKFLHKIDADVCVVICGINDIIGGDKRGASYVIDRLKSIYSYILSLGKVCVGLGILPLGVGHAGNDSRGQQQIIAVNKFCSAFRHPRFFYANAYNVIVDPSSAAGVAQAALLSDDHLHLSAAGARAIGYNALEPIFSQLFDVIDPLPRAQSDSYAAAEVNITTLTSSGGVANAELSGHGLFDGDIGSIYVPGAPEFEGATLITRIDQDNFQFPVGEGAAPGPIGGTKTFSMNANGCPNPLMQGSGGSVSGAGVAGQPPNNIQIRLISGAATVAAGSEARLDGYGRNAVADISGAASGTEISINGTASWIRAFAREKIQVGMHVELTGMINVGRLLAYLSVTINGNVYQIDLMNAVPTTFDNDDFAGVLVSVPFTIPESNARPTSMSFNARVIFAGAGGAAKLAIGRVFIQNLTMVSASGLRFAG